VACLSVRSSCACNRLHVVRCLEYFIGYVVFLLSSARRSFLGIPVCGAEIVLMRAVLMQNVRDLAKYAANMQSMWHICVITEICGINDTCDILVIRQGCHFIAEIFLKIFRPF